MTEIIDKFYYDNKRIRHLGQTYNRNDDTDMEILCNTINSILTENAIQIHKMKTQLRLIKGALELE